MRSLLQRAMDFYQLKTRYRCLLNGFMLVGMLAALWPFVSRLYDLQISMGLTPGSPIGSEPGSLLFGSIALVGVLVTALTGLLLGALVLCLGLAATRQLTFRDAIRAVFMSHYPAEWFRENPPERDEQTPPG